jgi:hypothetical protein
MNSLYVNLVLSNNVDESFNVERNVILNDDFILVSDLSNEEKIVYDNFIGFVGNNYVIINDIGGDVDLINFSRFRLFEHDSNYNILNISSFAVSYDDYSTEEKTIVDSFLELLSQY